MGANPLLILIHATPNDFAGCSSEPGLYHNKGRTLTRSRQVQTPLHWYYWKRRKSTSQTFLAELEKGGYKELSKSSPTDG